MKGFSAMPIFVAVVENSGFSAAARKLGISKSAVSKRINQLEDHLGVRLLHRTTRKLCQCRFKIDPLLFIYAGLELTPPGLIF